MNGRRSCVRATTDNGKKEHTFLWYLENYSFCWHKNGDRLYSPKFAAPELQGTMWYLQLFPRGARKQNEGYISVYLNRNEEDDGPEIVPLQYELSVLPAEGATLCSNSFKCNFKKGDGSGKAQMIRVDDVLLCKKTDPFQDNLTVRCKISLRKGDIHKVGQSSARTRIGIEKVSFVHNVENFSQLEPNQKKTVLIQHPSKKKGKLSSILYLTEDSCCEGKIIVEIVPSESTYVLVKQKLFLLDGCGNTTKCGEVDIRFDATRKDIRKLPLDLTKQLILNRKSEYLPNDVLSLLCECSFSTGVEFEKIEEVKHDLGPMVAFNERYSNACDVDGCNFAKKLSACPSSTDDLTTILSSQYLTDMEIKTKTISFPAHKIVLSARSPVFKAMLSHDMKEKSSCVIQVDDLDDYTLQQLVLFLYSDRIENLQWNSALKLYYAGDKYAIEKLKLLCCSFLVENTNTSNAGDLLLLADTHNDYDLKKFVEDFILKHADEVFSSDEWEKLIELKPQLVLNTMHLKYKRKRLCT